MFKHNAANRYSVWMWMLLVPLLWATSSAQARVNGLPDFTSLVEKHGPSVVNISTTQKVERTANPLEGLELPEELQGHPLGDLLRHFLGEYGQGMIPDMEPAPNGESTSLGSGFIISADGYILTNYHVVNEAEEIVVRLLDRRQFKARLIGTDQRSDMALLKIQASNLPVVKIGKSRALKVGEWVLAIGSPFGFDNSVTAGIVSAKERSLPSENYVPFIQTDVAINPGNSGGPLFNLDGEVVGINSQIYSRTGGFMGLSFAIPIDVAMEVVEQLKKTGRVSRGWLGVLIQDVDRDLAESFGMNRPQGALVSKILKGSPARSSDLRVGDIIIEFNHVEVPTSASLPPIVGRIAAGEKVPVKVIRQQRVKSFDITIGELPDDETIAAQDVTPSKPEIERNQLGLIVDDLSPEQRAELDIRKGGVLVSRVVPGPAMDAGVRPGDVILMLNNHEVSSVAEFNKVSKSLPAGKQLPVLLQRSNGALFLAMKIDK